MRIILIILDQADFFIGNSVAMIGVTGGIFSLLQDRRCSIGFARIKNATRKLPLRTNLKYISSLVDAVSLQKNGGVA